MTLNLVTTSAAKKIIPPEKSVVAARMKPSQDSLSFAKERAAEIAQGVTPQREKELHRRMSRLHRIDYKR